MPFVQCHFSHAVFAAVLAALATPTLAQTQTPSPAPPPASDARADRITMPTAAITRAEVRALIEGALAFAAETKIAAGIALVDQSGDLIAAERSEGGTFRNLKFATGKAFAAAIFGQTTEQLGAVYKTRPDRYFGIMNMYPGKVYLVGGGVPLTLNGKLIGAVGVAGLPEGVDEKAGRAGIAAWMKFRETMKK